MNDSMNNKELVAVGHQFAKAMSSDTAIIDMAKMFTRLAERLDCTTAALREMTKDRDAEHGDVLTWEKTMFKACGEDGPKSVADKFTELQAKCAALAAENAGLKQAAEFSTAHDMWEELGGNVMRYQYQEWYADKLKSAMGTPATDSFLAEVRAQGIDAAIEHLLNKFAVTGHIGLPVMALEWLAKELRKGVQS